MRQGQNNNNKRTRGRGRKPQSASNRTYDSNGPDVKIRGTASHVAEKYITLARDAQVSGDRVASENYLQHAEHYLRIVAAAQAQNQAQNPVPSTSHGGGDQPQAVNGESRGEGAQNAQNAQNAQEDRSADGRPDRVGRERPGDDSDGSGEGETRARRPRSRRARPKTATGDEQAGEAVSTSKGEEPADQDAESSRDDEDSGLVEAG